jgi:hypothetical protein
MKHLKILGIMLIAYALNGCDFLKATNQNPAADLTKLPPETQEGKNTFGCLVNGKVWRNQGFTTLTGNLSVNYNGNISIIASKMLKDLSEGVAITGGGETGVYSLAAKNRASFGTDDRITFCEYGGNTAPISGETTITKFQRIELNGGKRLIVSGRFYFTVVSKTCKDTIRVTDGRFDVLL